MKKLGRAFGALLLIAVSLAALTWFLSPGPVNFVAALNAVTTPKGMYAKREAGNLHIGISWVNGGVTEFVFRPNDDGLLLLRGAYVNPEDEDAPYVGVIRPMEQLAPVSILSPRSIPDFAIAARPAGWAGGSAWVPQHSSSSGVSVSAAATITVDGVATQGDFELRPIASVVLQQTFIARHPLADVAMWRHSVTHSISLTEPALHIRNVVEATSSIEVSSFYLAMLPAVTKHVSAFYLGGGEIFAPIPTDDARLILPPEIVTAAFRRNEGRTSYVAAVYTPAATHQVGASFVTFRGDDVTKAYWGTEHPSTIPAGTTYAGDQYILLTSGPSAAITDALTP